MNFMENVVGVRKLTQLGEYVLRFDDIRHAMTAFVEIGALRRWPCEFVKPAYFHNVPQVETPFWTPNESCAALYVFLRLGDKWVTLDAKDSRWFDVYKDVDQAFSARFGDCIESFVQVTQVEMSTILKVSFWGVTQADAVASALKTPMSVFSSSMALNGIVGVPLSIKFHHTHMK
jgi:hypothetical protein